MVDRPHWGWWLAIGGGLGVTFLVAFLPAAYDLWCRYVTTALSQGVVQAIFVGALVTHAGEAAYASRVARRAGLGAAARGWFWQTFVLGFPSLRLLHARTAARR